ncbi:hypothetical protein GM921_07835 [Pedobacter sp. LMG 31464]|uniref:Uncharacterized protein n=1 Tax=Pedobacter planticolens TaxID=2679964 RepID=A0A923E0M6_9SPHI|nr:hypothetical protein [Pedobacter planticolens]MBB2145389.1 hypothetical protein [Pedobacter planticolens]
MKINIIALLILITGQTFGQTSPKVIFFYKPYTNSSETNLYRDTLVKFDFKTQYENIENADIEKEVQIALLHNDYRIVGISGNSYLYPGLEGGYKTNKDGTKAFIGLDPKYKSYIKKYGFKVIQGTSDSMNPDNPPMQGVAYEYAKKYNLLLLEKMKTKK